MVGEPTQQDSNDEKYLKLASAGIRKLDAEQGKQRQIRKIISTRTQVVEGILYLMEVELCTPEICNGKRDIHVCDICTLDLWQKEWINFLQITKLECPIQKKWNYKYTSSE